MRRLACLALLLGLLSVQPAMAQFAVIDAANLTQNTQTALQSLITAIQSVQLVADSALNLAGWGSTMGGLAQDASELTALLAEAEGLVWDIRSLEVQITILFGLDTAPDNARALRERLFEIRRVQYERYLYAARLQTLMFTAIRIVQRIANIIDRVGSILGNKQAHIQVSDALTQLNSQTATYGAAVGAYQQASAIGALERPLIEESVSRISLDVCDRLCK